MKAKKLILALLGMVTALSLSAQTTVRGVVTDESGEPLMGAGVMVQGTTVGTVTGLDGDYELVVPADAENLVYSFIGLEEQTVAIAGRSVIDVVLKASDTFLDEVVVVGYATVKRRDLLGSVSSVGSDKLTEQPVTTVSPLCKASLTILNHSRSTWLSASKTAMASSSSSWPMPQLRTSPLPLLGVVFSHTSAPASLATCTVASEQLSASTTTLILPWG